MARLHVGANSRPRSDLWHEYQYSVAKLSAASAVFTWEIYWWVT